MDMKFKVKSKKAVFLLSFALAFLAAAQSEAAIYFRGKEVTNDAKAVADFEKIYWVGDCPTPGTDRIMVHMQLRATSAVGRLLVVMQAFDTKGDPVTAFSASPKKCDEHPSDYWRKIGASADGANRFPFCGVENPLVEVNPKNTRLEAYKNGEKAWFYIDFKRDKNVQSIRIVNVVLDGKEVQYNVKVTGNRLARTLSQPSTMKHSTEATFGNEATCRNWLPKDTAAAGAQSGSKPGATYGGASYGNSTYGGNTYGNKTYGGGTTYGGGNSTYGGNTYGGNTYGGGNKTGTTYGGNTYGGNTYGGNTYGGNKTGTTYGGNTYGGNTYGGNTYGGNTYGGGNSTYGGNQGSAQRQQPSQQSWNSSGGNYTLPEPAKIDIVPGRKVRIAEAQAGDIVILQYVDGTCGATMTHRKSPDEEDSRIRPSLYAEGAQKTPLTLDFGTKTKPQVIEVQQAASYWMELRDSAMGIVSYKAWLIPARDKYRFYASPQGKQLKPQTTQGYQSY